MTFFLDNNLPQRLASALRTLAVPEHGETVIHLRDRFDADATDETWLETLRQEGEWTILSRDHFQKGGRERAAFRNSGLHVFIVQDRKRPFSFWELSWRLVYWWPILHETTQTKSPGIYPIPVNPKAHLGPEKRRSRAKTKG